MERDNAVCVLDGFPKGIYLNAAHSKNAPAAEHVKNSTVDDR